MANTKISALTSATTPLAGTEVLPIVQSGATVKVANNDLRPKQIQSNATSGVMQILGPAAAATRVMTIPDANFTVARTDAGQTFTGAQQINGLLSLNTASSGIQTARSMSFLTTGGCTQYVSHSTSDGNGDTYAEYGYNGTKIGSISQSGTTGVNFNTTSDYRLKNVTGPLVGSGEYIDSLEPVVGTWKSDGSVFIGLIAHQAQEVSKTNIATGEKDGEEMQSLAYANPEFIANMIAELKSLRKRVAQLEAKG